MTYHPDHIAIHQWVTTAWRQRGRPGQLYYATSSGEFIERFRLRFAEWNMHMSDERPTGVPADQLDIHLRLAGCELDRKLTALRAMATQTSGVIAMLDPATDAAQVAEEWFIAAG